MYPDTYTEAEHRRGLEALRADVLYDTTSKWCVCGSEMEWERATEDGAGRRFPAGWGCSACGRFVADEIDEDAR